MLCPHLLALLSPRRILFPVLSFSFWPLLDRSIKDAQEFHLPPQTLFSQLRFWRSTPTPQCPVITMLVARINDFLALNSFPVLSWSCSSQIMSLMVSLKKLSVALWILSQSRYIFWYQASCSAYCFPPTLLCTDTQQSLTLSQIHDSTSLQLITVLDQITNCFVWDCGSLTTLSLVFFSACSTNILQALSILWDFLICRISEYTLTPVPLVNMLPYYFN